MYHGFCELIIDNKPVGEVEYRFDNTQNGFLWLEQHLHKAAFQAQTLSLSINDAVREITIRISTPGEATPFYFKTPT